MSTKYFESEARVMSLVLIEGIAEVNNELMSSYFPMNWFQGNRMDVSRIFFHY